MEIKSEYALTNLFSHLERSLHQRSVHCCHTLQLLPCVLIVFFNAIKTAVFGLTFSTVTVIAVLRDVVVISATSAARVSFTGKS